MLQAQFEPMIRSPRNGGAGGLEFSAAIMSRQGLPPFLQDLS
jgi:hypothetical protein